MYTNSFFKTSLLVFLCTAVSLFALPEETDTQHATPTTKEAMAQLNQKLTNWVAKVYNEIPDLTPEQQEKLTPILAKQFFKNMVFQGKMKELRAKGASRKEMRALREKMGNPKRSQKQIESILTKEQFKSYQAYMKKIGSKRPRGGKQGGGRLGGGGGGQNRN